MRCFFEYCFGDCETIEHFLCFSKMLFSHPEYLLLSIPILQSQSLSGTATPMYIIFVYGLVHEILGVFGKDLILAVRVGLDVNALRVGPTELAFCISATQGLILFEV